MKKIVALMLALVLIMSMTINASAYRMVNVDYDLKGATCTAMNSEYEDCYDYMMYITGDIDYARHLFGPLMGYLDDALGNPANYVEDYDATLMGIYMCHINFDPAAEIGEIAYTITPQIGGFNESTQYQLFLWNGIDAWEPVISAVRGNSIRVNVDSNGTETFALAVDKNSLGNEAAPAKSGNDIHLTGVNGTDDEGNTVLGYSMIYRFDEDVSFSRSLFNSLFTDDLYFTLLNSNNQDVDKDDLELMEKMDVIIPNIDTYAMPLTLTFEYDKVNPNSKIYVFHDKSTEEDSSPDWELIIPTVGSGTFTAEFNSLSPVVLYADATTLNGYVDDSTPLSPVTGDGDMNYIIFLGLIALASMGIVAKKYNR